MKEKLFIFSIINHFISCRIYDKKHRGYNALKNMIKIHSFNNACISYNSVIYIFYGSNYHLLCNNDKIITI